MKLTAGDAAGGDQFGGSVAIGDGMAVVGSRGDDDDGSFSGSAYVFNSTTGNQMHKLTAADAASGDQFGASVAVSGFRALVGSILDDDGGASSGSAYVFNVGTGDELLKVTANDAAASDRFGSMLGLSGDLAVIGSPLSTRAGITSSGAAYVVVVPVPGAGLGGLALLSVIAVMAFIRTG
jgi:hypothetical protein